MREYVILSILLLFVGLVSARPADKLSKDDFNVNSFLKKTRIQMVSLVASQTLEFRASPQNSH